MAFDPALLALFAELRYFSLITLKRDGRPHASVVIHVWDARPARRPDLGDRRPRQDPQPAPRPAGELPGRLPRPDRLGRRRGVRRAHPARGGPARRHRRGARRRSTATLAGEHPDWDGVPGGDGRRPARGAHASRSSACTAASRAADGRTARISRPPRRAGRRVLSARSASRLTAWDAASSTAVTAAGDPTASSTAPGPSSADHAHRTPSPSPAVGRRHGACRRRSTSVPTARAPAVPAGPHSAASAPSSRVVWASSGTPSTATCSAPAVAAPALPVPAEHRRSPGPSPRPPPPATPAARTPGRPGRSPRSAPAPSAPARPRRPAASTVQRAGASVGGARLHERRTRAAHREPGLRTDLHRRVRGRRRRAGRPRRARDARARRRCRSAATPRASRAPSAGACRPAARSTVSRVAARIAGPHRRRSSHDRRARTRAVTHSAIGAASGWSRSDTITKGRSPAHALGVPRHHVEVGADVRGEVGLVDDEQVGAVTPGPPLRGMLSPPATSMTKICASTSPWRRWR